MSSFSSFVSSSVNSKDSLKIAEVAKDPLKTSDMSKKSQCDLCKLSYSSEMELLEHSLSLMHHTKLEDKEENLLHECTLCGITCSNMADYRRHIATDTHQQKLSNLKGDKDSKSNWRNNSESKINSRYSLAPRNDSTNVSNYKQFQRDDSFPEKRKLVQHTVLSNKFGKDNQGAGFRFGYVKANLPSQMWNRDSWKGRYPYTNDVHHWSREGYVDLKHDIHMSGKDDLEQQGYEQSGSKIVGGYYDYQSNGGYPRSRRWENSQEMIRRSLDDHNQDVKGDFDDPSCMDFANDVLPSDWDENSLLEHEQFLAGIDNALISGKQNSHQGSKTAHVYKWDEPNVRDRKRPRNDYDVQESLAKSSRSVDSSSDENIPVRDVPRRHSSIVSTPSAYKYSAASAPTNLNILSKMSTIDDASNNILERAERLCKELKEKREASQVQRSLLLKKQEHESLNQRMSALEQRQQLYIKGHITDSKKQVIEDNDSGLIPSSHQQVKKNGISSVQNPKKLFATSSGAHTSWPRANGKTLEEIKKSTEKSMLENQEKPLTSNKTLGLRRIKQKSLSGEDTELGRISVNKDVLGTLGHSLSKPASKPHLTKDNIKKMINTPNSRDERLQLIKMLHSRGEQKAAASGAPRTSLQLEGLYDSIFASKEVNFDQSAICDAQTIKLEDLSENVRQQILDLIGGDVSSQFTSHSEIGAESPERLTKKTVTSPTDVILLSDNEDLRSTIKSKKNSARKTSGSNTPIIIDDVIKSSKKTKAGSASKNGFKNSLTSPSNSLYVTDSGNIRQKSPALQKKETSYTDNDVIMLSPSDLNLDKKKTTIPRDKISYNSLKATVADKQNFDISSSNHGKVNFSKNKARSPVLSGDQNHNQLNSMNIREKFPTLLNISKARKMSSDMENPRTDLSVTAFSNHSSQQSVHSASDKVSDMQLVSSNKQTNLSASPTNVGVISSLAQTIQAVTSVEALQKGLSTQTATSQTLKSRDLVLPPSTWLINRTSPPKNYQSQLKLSSDRSSGFSTESLVSTTELEPSSIKNSHVKDILNVDLLGLDDIDHATAGNIDVSDSRINTVTSAAIDTTSSETMSKLLILSEKEEYVKQEKMNMDLRLSRLHRLLEQAVVQINKCTEQMNQLHKEEQELLQKRLSLLRDATSLKPNWRSDTSHGNDTAYSSESVAYDTFQTAGIEQNIMSSSVSNTGAKSDVSQGPTNSPISSTCTSFALSSPDKIKNLQGSSISRDDWLAKFSAYLPQDPVIESNKVTAVKPGGTLTPETLRNSLQLNHFFPERDISSHQTIGMEMKNKVVSEKASVKSRPDQFSEVAENEAATSSRGDVRQQTQVPSLVTSASALSATSIGEPSIHNLITAPIMYVGSFRSADHPMQLMAPVVLSRPSTESSLSKPRADTHCILDSGRNLMMINAERRNDNFFVHDSPFADVLHLPSPSKSYNISKNIEHGGEESDIGSVASSIASGSSLGEQITRYCLATPGASIESKDPFGTHELSVIMSDTSEQKELDSQEEEDNTSGAYLKKEDWYKSVRACSVSLERLDMNSKKSLYNMDEKAVKSAEALHLIERDFEDTVCPSSLPSDSGKRKKRKTKQERDIIGLTRRRCSWIELSSSDEEDSGNLKNKFDLDICAFTSQVKRNGLSTSSGKSDISFYNESNEAFSTELQSLSKVVGESDVTISTSEFLSPTKTMSYLDVTVAECDSSTSSGIVDSESIIHRTNTFKGMRNQKSPKSFSQDIFADINSSDIDVVPVKNGHLLSKSELTSSQPGNLKHNSLPDSSNLTSHNPGTTVSKHAPARLSYAPGTSIHATIDLTRHSTSPDHEISSLTWKNSQKVMDDVPLSTTISTSKKSCQYPGDFGPVFDIWVISGLMYVGHVNRGVRAYNMPGLNQNKFVKEYYFPYLQCMSVTELDGAVTMILGNGCNLVFCNPNDDNSWRHNLGTTIKCILTLHPLVYSGLDTGEICVFDTVKMAVRDRCICSDRPIHCLASGQEGTIKLLCVSSQDGTIVIVNAQQFLPIRILTGHTKTAFSMQVEGHRVFSGSGDHTVLIQNLHTAEVEHIYRDSKGLVKSVNYSQGYLFTGGMDKLVRCYNVKTHQLVQVYYGADRGVITKILVLGDLLITGNIAGSVDVVVIDTGARHLCHIDNCGLIFGNRSHLIWHLLEDHNISDSTYG